MTETEKAALEVPGHIVELTSQDRSAVCGAILRDLPKWFGIPESLDQYVADVAGLEVYGFDRVGDVIGFIAVKTHSPHSADVLGVKRDWHRRGIGRRLFAHVEEVLRGRSVRFLTIKTVGGEDPGPAYAATRRFYESTGFVAIETFPTLWSPDNPCLMMAKYLGVSPRSDLSVR